MRHARDMCHAQVAGRGTSQNYRRRSSGNGRSEERRRQVGNARRR